jgi:hypothetical protein
VLNVGRTYRVEVLAYNPHLEESVLDALRLLPFPDALRVDIATDEVPIPADGSIELMIEPLEEGASSLEFSVTRGSEFWFALQLDFQAMLPALFGLPNRDGVSRGATDRLAWEYADDRAKARKQVG